MARIGLRAGSLGDLKAMSGRVVAEPVPMPIPPGSIGPGDVRPGAIGGTHYYQVRNIIQIPFDDSLDSTYFLECFFQMPDNVKKISKARVWVQKKPFRTYNSAASGASDTSHTHTLSSDPTPANTSNNTSLHTHAGPSHTHALNGLGNQSATHTHVESGGGTTNAETQNHTHSDSGTQSGGTANTGTDNSSHGHTYVTYLTTTAGGSSHSHTITLTSGIFESGGAGNLTLYVADDGSAYGAAIVGPTGSDISNQDITSQLTLAAGDKRLKITASALMRVQVLLLLDLLVGVDPIDIGIT